MLLLFLAACANRSVYIPITQNTPLFKAQRQLKANAYIGTNHVELQSAYNPVNHLAIAGNINFGAGIAAYDAAIGTYAYNRSDRWRYELFLGYGFNSNYTNPANYYSIFDKTKITYDVNSVYNRTYLQPCIGYFGAIKMYKINFLFSASARISYLLFQNFHYRETATDQISAAPVYRVDRNYTNSSVFLLEPCITNKVGLKNWYGILQLQGVIHYSNEVDLRYTNFTPRLIFSAGVEYNFNFKKKRK